MKAAPGVAFNNRYRLVRQIAVGGMGEVWVARDESLARDIAVKVLKPEFVGNPDFLARFRTEARNAASLSHANIAQLYDYGEQGGSAYLVMELVGGEPMSDLLEREPVLPAARLLSILAQTARALHAAHVGGVVHRDIKPGNILLEHTGEVKITDFGVSLAANQIPMTAAGMVMGTAQYLSPEQAVGRPATGASDIYALGIVAYEAVAGNRPFTGKTPVDIAVAHVNEAVPPLPKNVHPDLVAIIMKMLAKDPLERPRSGAALAHTFEDIARTIADNPWPVGKKPDHLALDPTRHHVIEDTGPQILRRPPHSAPSVDHTGPRPERAVAPSSPFTDGGPGSVPARATPQSRPAAGAGVDSPITPVGSSSAPAGASHRRPGQRDASAGGQRGPSSSNSRRAHQAAQLNAQAQSAQSAPASSRPRLNPADYDELGATRPRGQLSDLRNARINDARAAARTAGSASAGSGSGRIPHAQSGGLGGSSSRPSRVPPGSQGLLDRVRSLGWFTLGLITVVALIMLATLIKGLVSPGASTTGSADHVPYWTRPVEFISALPTSQHDDSLGGSFGVTLTGKDVQW